MSSVDVSSTAASETGLPVSGRVFDAVISVFSLLLVAGIALDFRAHANGISFAEEGFLTPEHAFFYTAFLAVAGTLVAGTYSRRRAGLDWVAAVPAGYRWGVLGVLVFGFGGVGDFFWHSAFGFEQGFEALVSPSHMALSVGSVLFLASPMRAAMRREGDPGVLGMVPVVGSLTLVLAILGMFGGFVNPLVRPYPSVEYYSMREVVTMLVVFPLVYVGSTVVVCRRFDVLPGAFTAAFGLSGLAIVQAEGHFALVVPAVAAGVVADLFVALATLEPADSRAFRAHAATLPAVFVTVYFTVVDLRWGIDHSLLRAGLYNWSIHVVLGAIALAALVGVLFSYVVAGGGGPGGAASGGSEAVEDDVDGSDVGASESATDDGAGPASREAT